MSGYKATICNSPGWRSFDACTLGVSVPSPSCQDERFAAVLDLAARHFKSIRIDVTDVLYRHCFMAEGLPAEVAEGRARALGTTWVERHRPLIDACAVKPEVILWSQWHEHPDYVTVLRGFEAAVRTNAVLAAAIEHDVDAFFRRQGREPAPPERQFSRVFLVEEMAVMTLQARVQPALRLYPGDELACMNIVRRGLIPEAPRGLELEQFAQVNLRTRRPTARPAVAPWQLTG